ncbi:MAG: NUDIX domain-containing protein [Dehalococcoidia bacterium]
MTTPALVYCQHCGGRLQTRVVDGRERSVCLSCGLVSWQDPKLVAVALVERGGGILFVRRKMEPGAGLWALPGGYVDRGEPVEEAARREVKEEAGLEIEVGPLLGLYSEAGNPVVLAVYIAHETGGELAPGPEVDALGFFPPHALPVLAFPRDERVVQDWARQRCRAWEGHLPTAQQ